MVERNILIVEDDSDLAEGICLSLGNDNFRFVCCGDLAAAKEAFAGGDFDLLILDINLPDGSGLSFCREVRRVSRVPIILLRARIRALLRRNAPEEKSDYQDEIFHFSFGTMKFYKQGREIELSKTEQRILYLLVMHPGQILTREQLLEWVWPEGTEYVEDNALSVGIRRLRDKLEDVPGEPKYIRTLYGKGYVWDLQRL